MLDRQAKPGRQDIFDYVLELLREITADLDVPDISGDTQLGELGIESISLVYFIGELQRHFQLDDRLFENLRETRRNIIDLDLSTLLHLIEDTINGCAPRKEGSP